MNLAIDWINRASIAWWNYIVQTSWQAALVGVALLLIVHWIGPRWPAPLRYALLVLALLKFACPPFLPIPTGVFSQLASPAIIMPVGAPSSSPLQPAQITEAAAFSGHSQTRVEVQHSLVSWTVWLMALHGVGTAVVAFLVVSQAMTLRKIARRSRSRLAAGLAEEYRDLAIQFEVYQIPPLAISEHVDAPVAVGVPKPAIMLPARIVGQLSPAELRAVLAHELAHCRRGDPWVNWLQLILLAVWWFHPVVWLVNRSLRDAREDCCDDLLLARGLVSNDGYCDVLLRAASEASSVPAMSAALGLGGSIHPLGRRLARITDWTLQRCEKVSRLGAVTVLLAAALLFPGLRVGEAKPSNSAAVPGPPPVQSVPAVAQATRTIPSQQSTRAAASQVAVGLPALAKPMPLPARTELWSRGSPIPTLAPDVARTRAIQSPSISSNGPARMAANRSMALLPSASQAPIAGGVPRVPAAVRPPTPGVLYGSGVTIQRAWVYSAFPARPAVVARPALGGRGYPPAQRPAPQMRGGFGASPWAAASAGVN